MKKLTEVVYLPVSKVIRDEAQPRQYFDPIKLGRLSDSIKKMGIREPLTVEALPDGTFKIVDGERRWRAAQAIGLKEVPALIETKLSPSDRVIEQFHLQELREGWQVHEKAIAIKNLAIALGVQYAQAAVLVGVPKKTAEGYKAIAELKYRDEFIAGGVNTDWAQYVRGVIKTAKFQTRQQLNDEMSDEEVDALEKKLIQDMVSGTFSGLPQVRDLRDSIVKDAKNIKKYLKGQNPTALFKASDAQGVRAFRRIKAALVTASTLLHVVESSKDAQMLLEEDKEVAKMAEHISTRLNKLV